MAGIVVLFVHHDPVVQAIVGGMLADEVDLCFARNCEEAASAAIARQPALLLADTEGQGEAVQALVRGLRARDPHLRSVFFVEPRAVGQAWQLAELGTVLPKDYDLDRLLLAVRREERLWRLSRGDGDARGSNRGAAGAAVSAGPGDETSTRRQVRAAKDAGGADATATQRLSYFGPTEGDAPPASGESRPPQERDLLPEPRPERA
jgi:DNA-binding NtrC family response regulator